jgi:phytoene dehydrogenase-like protein
MGAGTGFTLMHNWALRNGMSHAAVAGGVGKISEALAAAVKSSGGEIRTGAEVKSITVDTFSCKGVALANGEEITASKAVISAADPKHTFLSLVGPSHLPPEFVWHTQSIKMRGSVSKVHLLTDGKHGIPQGTIAVAPSLKYLERAYDAAKYHGISENPYLEVTTSGNIVSIHFQYGAYKLRDSNWEKERKRVEDFAAGTLAQYYPNLKPSVKSVKSLTPKDIEDTYGMTEGDLNHGQLMLDQFIFMRPIPGWSNHKTPIDNLYLCGSGVHGGGGISGVSGRNLARVL